MTEEKTEARESTYVVTLKQSQTGSNEGFKIHGIEMLQVRGEGNLWTFLDKEGKIVFAVPIDNLLCIEEAEEAQ
jgi:hypothetical protein